MFTHKKAGFPQTNEESPLFSVYRIKSRFSVKRRNPNPSPTWKIKFGFLSFGAARRQTNGRDGQTAAPPALRPLQLPDERLQFRAAPRAARPRQLLLLHALRQRGKALHRLRIARKAAQE